MLNKRIKTYSFSEFKKEYTSQDMKIGKSVTGLLWVSQPYF